jgi:hypothetical protein
MLTNEKDLFLKIFGLARRSETEKRLKYNEKMIVFNQDKIQDLKYKINEITSQKINRNKQAILIPAKLYSELPLMSIYKGNFTRHPFKSNSYLGSHYDLFINNQPPKKQIAKKRMNLIKNKSKGYTTSN